MTGIELFTIGSLAVTVGDAFTVISGLAGALGSISQANAQADANEYNAQVSEQNAAYARQEAEAEAIRTRRENQRRLGQTAAQYGKAGVVLSEGSPLDVLGDASAEGELDAMIQSYKGERQGRYYDSEAQINRQKAKDARSAGLWNAGSTLLTTGMKFGSRTPSTPAKPTTTVTFKGGR